MLNFLVLEVKKITFGANKNHEAQLKAWDESINVFKLMEGVIKEVTNPIPFLGALLKYGRLFLGMNLKISNIPNKKNDNILYYRSFFETWYACFG